MNLLEVKDLTITDSKNGEIIKKEFLPWNSWRKW